MAKNAAAENQSAPETLEALPQMSVETLLGVIANMQQQLLQSQKAQADANAQLANAILESRKPYEDPRKKQNDDLFKENERKLEDMKRKVSKYAQDTCEHIAGCSQLSEQKDIAGRTSIIWHRGDVGQTTGICTVCGRIFRETDPDFDVWRRKKSFNKQSAAGERTVLDPLAARQKAYLIDRD